MFFGVLLMLTSLVIAGVAGWFSVYGLAHIYQGAFLSVVLMGGALEIGKLVATSYLYRYWEHTTWLLKTYLMVAILGLMLITSSGIFGYLSNAYQQDAVGIKDVTSRIELIDREYEELSKREMSIDAEVNAVDPKYVTARLKLMAQYKPEKEKLTARRDEIRVQKLELASKQLEVEAHTGPIIYIAKAMGKSVDTAVIWLSLLIIAVFDPLAVALTIAANAVFMRNRKYIPAVTSEPVIEPPRVVERIVEVPVIQDVIDHPAYLAVTNENDRLLRVVNDLQQQIRDKVAEQRHEFSHYNDRLQEQSIVFEELKAEKDRLVKELQEFLNETKDQPSDASSRLEHSLQNQVAKLNKTVERTELELQVALEGIDKRDLRIEELEATNAELEDQVVELRMTVKRLEAARS